MNLNYIEIKIINTLKIFLKTILFIIYYIYTYITYNLIVNIFIIYYVIIICAKCIIKLFKTFYKCWTTFKNLLKIFSKNKYLLYYIPS